MEEEKDKQLTPQGKLFLLKSTIKKVVNNEKKKASSKKPKCGVCKEILEKCTCIIY